MKTFGVIGAGQMGAGIAQVAAMAGYDVILRDVEDRFLERGMEGIVKSLEKLVAKEKLSKPDRDAAFSKIKTCTMLEEMSYCDLIVEAIIEDEAIKLELFKQLGQILKPSGVLASNTSSIPITKLAASSGRAEQFIGMHFMNPVPLMPLVEVIRGHLTNQETTNLVLEASRKMGKTPIECNDFPGFVSNRILMPMINEAIQCVLEGVAEPEAIDSIMKLGMNHPMGPLTLADFIGLDTCLSIMEVLQSGLGDDKYRPSPLLRKMVQAGLLGRKSGRGFYTY
jgi:3-hydroxybutyryl-CoA dehydrogenase